VHGRDSQELHLRDYVNILRRRWVFFLIPLLLAPLWQGIPILRMHPSYQASVTMQLEPEKGMSNTFFQSFSPEFFFQNEKWVNNQINIVRGKAVAEKVVRKLGLRLQMKPEERIYQILLRMWISDFPSIMKLWNLLARETHLADPFSRVVVRPMRVNDGAKEGYYFGVFKDPRNFTIHYGNGKIVGKGEIGKEFSGPNFSCLVEGVGREGKEFEFHIISELSALLAVQGSLKISPVKETNLINVDVQWKEPVTARDIANAVVEAFQETVVAKKTEDLSQVLSFVEGQLKVTEEDLRKAEEDLKKFKGKEKIVNLDAQVREDLEQAAQYGKELNTLAIQRKQAEIVLAALKDPKKFTEKEALFSMGAGLNDSTLMGWGKKLSDLTIQRSALLTLYKEEHPKVKQIDREIESVKRSIISGIMGLISSIGIREKAIQANLEKVERKIQNIPAKEQELFGLQRIVKVNTGVNDFLLQKRAELSVNRASMVSNVYVVDMAVVPTGFVGTDLIRKIMMALLIGGALGVCLAFLVEYFDTAVKTPEQIKNLFDLPYLGTIYHFNSKNRTYRGELQMIEAPYSHVAEAFRTIKANLIFTASVGNPKKSILITSAVPSEGKTFVTANLGVALAQSGKRVLLVETDLRNPSLHQIFEIEKSPGLSNTMLNGEILYSHLPIQGTEVENLEFLASGDKPPNPSELLCSEKMERVFSALRDQYDFVLFDSPPVFLTSDPIILAQRLDGVILVARSGETKKDIFKEAVERLLRVDAKILGILFNDMYQEGKKSYYDKYRHYYGEGKSKNNINNKKNNKVPLFQHPFPPVRRG